MSRCPDCGMKECCGSYMYEDIELKQAEIDALIRTKANWMEEFNKAQAEIDRMKEYIFDLQAEIEGLKHKGE